MNRTFSLTLAVLVALALAPVSAHAQWTLRQGDVLVGTNFDFQYANSEFFGLGNEERAERGFPLRGEYIGSSMNIAARAGFTDELELELVVPLRVVSYGSDPVLLLPQPDDAEPSLDFYQRNIIQLSQTTAGLADVQVAVRYRWLAEPFLLTTELRLKTPGGYEGPAGTFGERPESAQDLVDNVATYVRPENVRDDVTLGDGQVDLTPRLLLGASFPTRTFVAGDAGYNVRFGGAADQIVASLRAGQMFGDILLVYVGASMAMSVGNGRRIGVSVAAIDPDLPAAEYGGTTNLLLREVRLLRDYVDVYGGVILRITPEIELKVGYGRTVWGRNVAAVNTFTLGIGGRTHLFDIAPAAAPIEEPPPPPPPEEPLIDVVEEPLVEPPPVVPEYEESLEEP